MKMHLVGIVAILLLISTEILGYPPQERIMPDETPVPEDAVEHEDSVAAASEVGEEYDDSDMYMEPDDEAETAAPGQPDRKIAETSTRKNDDEGREETSTDSPAAEDRSAKPPSEGAEKPGATVSADQEAKNTEDAGRYVDGSSSSSSSSSSSLETESQNFFPSFAELFANHRVPFSEQRYRPNRFLGYFQRDRNQAAATATKDQPSLLGSGNFGVIRGGTYYPEDKENDEYSVDESLYNPYYHGRGRAQYYRNPKPQPVRGGDFFANFRDFADITAPPKSSFSHLSVVYANKNGSATATGRVTEPRNIIETLRMLEEQEEEEEERSNADEEMLTTEETPRKKQSKGKRKLMKMKQYEEDKARRSRMSVEPLLALS